MSVLPRFATRKESRLGSSSSFRDVTERRGREQVERDALAYAENIVDTVQDSLLILDAELRVHSASRSFYEDFDVVAEETIGKLVYELGNGQWNIPKLRTLLENVLPHDGCFRHFEVTHAFEGVGERRLLLNGCKVRS